MPAQYGANLYTQGFGSRPESIEVPHLDVRIPASTDIYPIGKRWIDTVGNAEYVLTSISSIGSTQTANWVNSGSVSSNLNTLTDGVGGVVNPVANNIQLSGTASQITTTAGVGAVTFSMPASVVTPGSLSTTTGLTAGSGFTVTAGAISTASGASTVNIGAAADTGTINLGASTAGQTINVGTTSNAANAVAVRAGNTNGFSVSLTAKANAITVTSAAGGKYWGMQSNSAPTAGFIGEEIRSAIASGSAVTLTNTGTAYEITSITLSAGVWDISACLSYTTDANSVTAIVGSINTSVALGTQGDNSLSSTAVPLNGFNSSLSIPSWRYLATGTPTIYLIAQASFTSTPAVTAFGRISAKRVA
jgi:hypothetical protein